MYVNICRALLYSFFCSVGFAHASLNIDTTIDITKGDTLEVLSAYTNVHIYSWDKMAIGINGTTDTNISDYEFGRKDGTVQYKEIIGNRIKQKSYKSDNTLAIRTPKDIDIIVRTSYGSIHIQRINGEVSASSENGNIDIYKVEQQVDVNSQSGNIKVSRTKGEVKIHSLKGNIEVYNSHGNFEINAIDGDIYSSSNFDTLTTNNIDGTTKLKFTTIDKLSINSSNGDIDIQTTILEKTKAKLKSVLGDIQISTPPISNAEFKIETHQGKIKNYVNEKKASFDNEKGVESLFFRVGEVSSKFEAKSVRGSITLFSLDNIPVDKKRNFLARHLKKLSSSNFDTFYANPDAIIDGQQAIYFEPLLVEFSQEWNDHFKQNLSANMVEALKSQYNEIFQLRIRERFNDTERFELVTTPQEATLIVAPKISVSVSQHVDTDDNNQPKHLQYASVTVLEVKVTSTADGSLVAQVKDSGCGCVSSYENPLAAESPNTRAYKKVFYWWAKELFEHLGGKTVQIQ